MFGKISEFLKKNKAGAVLFGIAAILSIGMVVASGCRISDAIKVPVPKPVQVATGVNRVVTLTEAEDVRDEYVEDFKRGLDRFDQNIEDAYFWHDTATSLLNTGTLAAEGALAGVPGGAIALSVLTGFAGLMTRKPGTDREIQRAKQDSFNKGQSTAKELLAQAATTSLAETLGVNNAS